MPGVSAGDTQPGAVFLGACLPSPAGRRHVSTRKQLDACVASSDPSDTSDAWAGLLLFLSVTGQDTVKPPAQFTFSSIQQVKIVNWPAALYG